MLRSDARTAKLPSLRAELALLLGIGVLIGLYSLFRFAGLWGEIDSSNAAIFIRIMTNNGELASVGAYPNGYAYQALAVFLTQVGAIPVGVLQVVGGALLGAWVVIAAWLAYRELTGSPGGATLATVILFAQPEFLFAITRGTHEKFTRGLMLLALYLLLRSLRSADRPQRFLGMVLAFYLAIYAAISFNAFLTSSFIAALLLAWLLSAVPLITRRDQAQIRAPLMRRLVYVTFASLILFALFTLYLYAPAQHDLQVMQTIADRVSALFLDVETTASNPYTQWVAPAWINLPVYFLMTLANWLLLLVSAALWVSQTLRWLLRRWKPRDMGELLLWALYGAFAFQGAASILVDLSGSLSTNMQHRIFPSFAMLAAPLVARWLMDIRHADTRRAMLIKPVVVAGAMLLMVLSILKATNEPAVSNKWLFYTPAEATATDWAGGRVTGGPLWLAYDERLLMGLTIRNNGIRPPVDSDIYLPEDSTRDFLISEVTRRQAVRMSFPLPVGPDDTIAYDNGSAQIFHRRPVTPYQR